MHVSMPDVIPLIACADIAAEHDYLIRVLGFESGGLEQAPDGKAVHGEVRIGSHRIWLHPVNAGELEPPRAGPAGGGIVLQVHDVDAHHERARAAGAEILYAPRDQEYGQREYGVRDPEGHYWWIGTAHAPPAAR
jgi:MerR family transcriptional regulator, thiopeptide resistance regulator